MRRKEGGLFTAMLAGGVRPVEGQSQSQPQPQESGQAVLPTPSRIPPPGTGIFSGILGPGGEVTREKQAGAAAVKAAEQAAAKSGVFTVTKPVHPGLLNRTRQFSPLIQNTLRFPEPEEREPVPPEPAPQREVRTEPESVSAKVIIVKAHGGEFVMINDPALREQFANSGVGQAMPARGGLLGNAEVDDRLKPLTPENAARLKNYIEKL